jgi:hypothetical protein
VAASSRGQSFLATAKHPCAGTRRRSFLAPVTPSPCWRPLSSIVRLHAHSTC